MPFKIRDFFIHSCNRINFTCLSSSILIFIVVYLNIFYYNLPTETIEYRTRDLKKILYWNSLFSKEDYAFGFGNSAFLVNKCEFNKCFITNDKNFTEIDQFDAIIFHGPTFNPKKPTDFPAARSPSQYYAYYTVEPPALFRTRENLNGFFNLTINYRLDSDITETYYTITDHFGNVVAPAWHPQWASPTFTEQTQNEYLKIYNRKSRVASWIVSKCGTGNNRMGYVRELQKYTKIDIYGKCGTEKCASDIECFELLRDHYYFFLAFENNNCEDYASEKVYNAIFNDAIPVVMNGADMNRFLPPHSYIDARNYTPKELSVRMDFLMQNPEEYAKYFWWKKFYRPFYSVPVHPFCKLCELLYDEMRLPKTYHKITKFLDGDAGNPRCTNSWYHSKAEY